MHAYVGAALVRYTKKRGTKIARVRLALDEMRVLPNFSKNYELTTLDRVFDKTEESGHLLGSATADNTEDDPE